MKRSIKSILCGIAAVAVMSVCAFAADNTPVADKLKQLGLFNGTTTGYQLDRAPTRAESAAMLVRLLGSEQKAQSENYEHPFSDVPEWASPYVGYLYQNKLTNGIGNGKFGSALTCSEQMYCTFALRALGYTDENDLDFKYSEAVDFAENKGLPVKKSDNFLRDDVVLISYQALATDMKSESSCLLASLVKQGAVQQTAADSFLKSLEVYHDYVEAMDKLAQKAENGISFTANTEYAYGISSDALASAQMAFSGKANASLQYLPNSGNLKLAFTSSTSDFFDEKNSVESSLFVKDGTVFAKENGQMAKVAQSEATDEIDTILAQIDTLSSAYPGFYQFDSVARSNDKIILKLSSNDLAKNVLSVTSEQLGDVVSDIQITEFTETIVLDSDGIPKSQSANVNVKFKVNANGSIAVCNMQMNAENSITALGNAVSVEYPKDLASY